MPSSHSLDRIAVTFDDENLVANAGLLAPATLAERLGLRELLDETVDLGDVAGHANVGAKAMTVIHSVLAGADSIDDCDVLRAGATSTVLGHLVAAPSTIGTFLRALSWAHSRQLDSVSKVMLARAWAAPEHRIGRRRSRSTWTARSMRLTGSRRKAPPGSPTRRCAATTRYPAGSITGAM